MSFSETYIHQLQSPLQLYARFKKAVHFPNFVFQFLKFVHRGEGEPEEHDDHCGQDHAGEDAHAPRSLRFHRHVVFPVVVVEKFLGITSTLTHDRL